MKSLIRLLILSAFSAGVVTPQQHGACSRMTVRKEVRQLSAQEWDDFINAVKAVHTGTPPTIYDKYVDIHLQNVPVAHAIPAFFPWHRMFVKAFEQQLQQINPKVAIPYWDWTLDSQAPEKSMIWDTKYFGSSGDTNCVTDGPFAGWIMNTPQPHCLRRKWNKGKQISAFYPPELLSKILNEAKSYSEFRTAIEAAPHGLVHVNIGSDGGDISTMWSPNDPVFWLHHSFVDKIWSDFQLLKPALAKTYDGKDKANRTVTLDDVIAPFNVRVADILDTNSPPLCYRY
ncbi:Di-copper centre-containing protein, partial [Basidiobolus meristosporus CBS 931.73]